ncbi:MAG: tryptophan--tRNA ligase, partial [Chloroflexi bacterium]|nr:tryptophan--tRNA ligase [Chloroflexota bacterium]
DQKQHVELTRDIAERFNSLFEETFTVPAPLIPPVGARIMSLDDPSRKMDKSNPAGALLLLESPGDIRKKVARAVTDSLGVVGFNPEQAGLYNLLTMIQLLSGQSEEQILTCFGGGGYRAVKEELADLVVETLQPVQDRYREFERNPDVVDRLLDEGAERAHEIAAGVLAKAQRAMGLRARRGARSALPSAV